LGITYSRQYIWELERDGLFPARVQLGPRAHGWRQSEIAAWLQQRTRGKLKPRPPEDAELKPRRPKNAEAQGAAA
jgi:hypothetical protein